MLCRLKIALLNPLPPAAWVSMFLIACASAAEPPGQASIVLVTVAEWPASAALADEVVRRSGVAVARVNAISSRTFALTLACASAGECQRAVERLAADTRFAREVQPDRLRALPPKPSPSSAR
jgi:hypothetical protein